MFNFAQRHKKLERNITMLASFAFVAVVIGGVVEIAGELAAGALEAADDVFSGGEAAAERRRPEGREEGLEE